MASMIRQAPVGAQRAQFAPRTSRPQQAYTAQPRRSPGIVVGPTQISTGGSPIRYVEVLDGIVEIKTQPIWHQVTLAAAATSATMFFNVGQTANRRITNMKQVQQLPGAQAYRLRMIAFGFGLGEVLADLVLVMNAGGFVLTVNSKECLEAPVQMLPYGGGLSGQSNLVAAAGEQHYNSGLPTHGSMYRLKEPIIIKGGVNYSVTVHWAAGITPSATTNVECALHGELFTPI